MAGWSMWVMKGGSILLRGLRPPLVFEAVLPVFAVGLLGSMLGSVGAEGLREGGRPGGLRSLGLGQRRLHDAARTLYRRGGVQAFPRLGVARERRPTGLSLPSALERPAARYGVGRPPLDLGGRGPSPDQRKVCGDPDRINWARLDGAVLFSVGSQASDGPITCTRGVNFREFTFHDVKEKGTKRAGAKEPQQRDGLLTTYQGVGGRQGSD